MIVEWSVPRGELGSIHDAMQGLMVGTRSEPGCVSCSLTASLDERSGLRYTEEWMSEADLVRQLRSDRFAKMTHLMDNATQPPRVEFHLPDGTRGLDYAEEVRAGNASA